MGAFTAMASVFLLAAHLVAMNVALSAPLICIWLAYHARRGDTAADAVGRRLARWSLWSLLVGIALGVILLGIFWASQDQRYWQAVERFPTHAYGFAAVELAFTAACLAVFAGMWNHGHRRPWLHALWAVLATTNLLYHFPPLMIVLGELSAQPDWVSEPLITRPGFRSLLLRPELIAKVLHFTLASVSVGGAALMMVARNPRINGVDEHRCVRLVRAGAAIVLAASLAQLVVGVWVLSELPAGIRNALLGGDWLASGLFFLSIVTAIGVLRMVGTVALGQTDAANIYRSVALLIIVICLMTGTQARTRQSLDHGRALLAADPAMLE